MKILKDDGKFEILSVTDDIIHSIASAARTCYQSQDKASQENDIKLVKNLIERGHTPMLEFADMTVRFTNVSRGFTHEMVRHRLCSFAQESTRYVDESDFQAVVPPHKDENEKVGYVDITGELDSGEASFTLNDWLKLNEAIYRSLRKAGWKPEDARQILPTAIKSDIVVKANMSEWRHIFFRRCDRFAHWEIRSLMIALLAECKRKIPIIFDDFIIFHNEPNKCYAKPIPSQKVLMETIEHFNQAIAMEAINGIPIQIPIMDDR